MCSLSLATISLGSVGRADETEPVMLSSKPGSRLADRRHVGQLRVPPRCWSADRPQLAGAGSAATRPARWSNSDLDMAGDEILHRRRAALVRHVIDVEAGNAA